VSGGRKELSEEPFFFDIALALLFVPRSGLTNATPFSDPRGPSGEKNLYAIWSDIFDDHVTSSNDLFTGYGYGASEGLDSPWGGTGNTFDRVLCRLWTSPRVAAPVTMNTSSLIISAESEPIS